MERDTKAEETEKWRETQETVTERKTEDKDKETDWSQRWELSREAPRGAALIPSTWRDPEGGGRRKNRSHLCPPHSSSHPPTSPLQPTQPQMGKLRLVRRPTSSSWASAVPTCPCGTCITRLKMEMGLAFFFFPFEKILGPNKARAAGRPMSRPSPPEQASKWRLAQAACNWASSKTHPAAGRRTPGAYKGLSAALAAHLTPQPPQPPLRPLPPTTQPWRPSRRRCRC